MAKEKISKVKYFTKDQEHFIWKARTPVTLVMG